MTQEGKTKILDWFKNVTIGQILIAASLFTAAHSGYNLCITIHEGVIQVQDAITSIPGIRDTVRSIGVEVHYINSLLAEVKSDVDMYQNELTDSLEFYRDKQFYYDEKYINKIHKRQNN